LRLQVESVYRRHAEAASASEHRIRAPMPGRVVLVQAKPGDTVNAGAVLLVLEAMKMELALKAPRAGVVAELRAQAGDFVEADAVLATLEQ
ncbi:MAG TPA: acetyl-CoA carboxylase biotin carboxyl carrier protein subunit, partial [Thermomonas sp.]|nr:acetyl-CoA carboxylase biotin carboxyl carrier protein subunit [Thermomonas sp.]